MRFISTSCLLFLGFCKALSAVVISETLGDVRVLYQNDLLGNSTSTSAFLLYKKSTFESAQRACSSLSESLLLSVPSDIHDQLNYLVFSSQLESSAQLYVAQRNSSEHSCEAYDIASATVVRVQCATRLSALCTQSSPPWRVSDFNAPVDSDRQIVIDDGGYRYTGYRDARSFRFLGVPFAEPPVGQLRFEAPVPYDGASDISALHHKKACIQAPSPYGVESLNQTSEDCLYLNVYTPFLPAEQAATVLARPVMVYFYGGSFLEGWASIPDYDGGNLASRGDVLLVTLGYRVGALGFLTTENLLAGNQGLQDQILALQWIQKHIGAFGGDPSRVTIFGQSAGAQSVVLHLSSSASKGLFSAGISQSSLLGVVPSTRSLNSKHITPAVAKGTNCSNNSSEASLVNCLKNIPAKMFATKDTFGLVDEAAISAYAGYDDQIEGLAVAEPYLPITAASGGPEGIVDDQLVYLIGNNSVPNRVPFMVGTNRNEAGLFIPYSPGFETQLPDTQVEYSKKLREVVPSDTRAAILNSSLWKLNTSDPQGVLDISVDILTEYAWLCPWQDLIQLTAARQTFDRLYNYVFDRGTPQALSAPARCFPEDNPLGQQICHTEEIPEVFGRTDIYGYEYNTTNSLQFSQYVMDSWISFATTYDPTPQRDYLEARGDAYRNTLRLSMQAPFAEYSSDPQGSVHHFDLPPFNSGRVRPGRCQVLADSGGFAYDRLDNSL